MMRISVTYDKGKLDKLLASIDKSVKATSGKDQTMYRQIGKVADVSTIKNFEAGGRPTWPPRKYQYDWPILRKTLLMMRKTLSYIRTNWQIEGAIRRLSIKSTYYGVFHQGGTSRLPARKFVLLSPEERAAITKIIRNFVELL